MQAVREEYQAQRKEIEDLKRKTAEQVNSEILAMKK